MLSRQLQKADGTMWQSEFSDGLVAWKTGLYPSPVAKKEDFAFLGLLVARAILDQRILDLPLNKVFVDFLMGREPVPSLRTLARIDPHLVRTLKNLENANYEAFSGLTFTHPAFPQVELLPGGANIEVTRANFGDYLDSLLTFIIKVSLTEVANSFIEAFNTIMLWDSFRIFSSTEFIRLVNGDREEHWDANSILHDIRADHGYTKDSLQIRWLAETFAELNIHSRSNLLQFLTGAPQLPNGGWSALRPTFTVVCRNEGIPDQSLPTVMTCANYFKLPRYSTKEILKKKLMTAIMEGGGAFLLS